MAFGGLDNDTAHQLMLSNSVTRDALQNHSNNLIAFNASATKLTEAFKNHDDKLVAYSIQQREHDIIMIGIRLESEYESGKITREQMIAIPLYQEYWNLTHKGIPLNQACYVTNQPLGETGFRKKFQFVNQGGAKGKSEDLPQ